MPISDLHLHGMYTHDTVTKYVDEFVSITQVRRSVQRRLKIYIRIETATRELLFQYTRHGLLELVENNRLNQQESHD